MSNFTCYVGEQIRKYRKAGKMTLQDLADAIHKSRATVCKYENGDIFLVFVIILPMFVVDIMGQGAPYFCKLICPAGTLEGGIPLVLLNKSMRSAVGWLYMWKNTILVITIILSIMIYRPFCKYICPLGAFYSVFNKVSVFRYRVDKEKCVHCGKCRNICQMEVDPTENPNSAECIRCGRCKKICPTQAIRCGFAGKP